MEKIIISIVGIVLVYIAILAGSFVGSVVLYFTLPTLIKIINAPCISERLSNISFWDLWICNIALSYLFQFMRTTPTTK